MTKTEEKLTAALFMACRTFAAECADAMPLPAGTESEKQRHITAAAVPLMEDYLKDVEEIGAEMILALLTRARLDAERYEQASQNKKEEPDHEHEH